MTLSTIETVIESKITDLGEFSVRRTLPSARRKMVGPFIFYDHMGPAEFSPGSGVAVRPHPHIGIATVTYLFDGEIMHRDSLGIVQAIRPGAVNWMTAGRGIVHSERSRPELVESGSMVHGIQSWIALPLQDEECEPEFVHYPAGSLPVLEAEGCRISVIAGEVYGVKSPVRTHSPMFYVDVQAAAGASCSLPTEYIDRAVYVVSGRVVIDDYTLQAGQMAVLNKSTRSDVRAAENARFMLLGGEPLAGDRKLWWNFVSSRPERIEQAKTDWKEGRFDSVPDDPEFIPLPE